MHQTMCYELKLFELDKSTNSCIRVIQENSIESLLQNWYRWSMLATVHPTLNNLL